MNSTQHAVPFAAANRAAGLIDRLWHASPPLTGAGILMLVLAGASLVGMVVDPRVITGAPAWLKPLKFAISTAVYSLTLAWMFTFFSDRPHVRRVVGWTTAIVFVLEVSIIDAQAWRGTTSHFNVSTTLDTVLFSVMGIAILLQTLVSVAVAAALWRKRFTDPVLGWALRLGMTLTIIGALSGSLMTRPTEAQLAAAREGGRMTTAGAHTVGGVDGSPGVPVTGWSRDHGDLRIAHFIGLHAIQTLALIAIGLRRWPGQRPFVSRHCWLLQRAMHRCFSCCCGRRCGDKASWRRMERHSGPSQYGPWSQRSSLVGSALAPVPHCATAWIGWQYDSRTALFHSEADDHGRVASAAVPARGRPGP